MSARGTWSFFNPDTGLFTGEVFSGNEKFLAANTPSGLAYACGRFSPEAHRIDVASGKVVNL